MPTVVLEKQVIELSFDQILSAVRQLTPEELARLRQELLDASWRNRLDDVLERMRQSMAADPLSDAQIDAEVEAVRARSHAESRH